VARLSTTTRPNDITIIDLSKTYNFRDDAHEKMEDWGRQLWRLLRENLEFDTPKLFRNRDDFQYLAERLTNYAVARLIARGMVVENETFGLPEDARNTAFTEVVDDILDVAEAIRDNVVWYLSRICSRIRKSGSNLTPAQSRSIKRFAASHAHRCYVCGQHLNYSASVATDDAGEPNVYSWRRFEIDHIFPQKRGGGRNRGNLAACCESCNKYKDVFLSFADFAIENVITPSADPVNVRAKFDGKHKFALLWRQLGACALCDTKFHDSPDERLFLQRRDKRDVFHFLNVQLVCGPCADTHSLEGVLIRE
jgi:5-methylcytosine-specific restriction endonuclease McrA